MKKKIFIIVVTVLALIGITTALVGCGKTEITKAEAKELVLQNIGATENQATYVTADLEEVNGTLYFEVEAVVQGVKYNYLINASSGSIEKQNINGQRVNPESAPASPLAKPENYVTREAAILVALENAGTVQTAVTELEVEFDYAFGNYLYEIEFKLNGVEYEYEINAVNGEIFEKAVGNVSEIIPSTTEAYLTPEKATEIALENAGFSSTEITLKKAIWELNNGVAVYEVEFIANGYEYEYTIQAVTGAILEAETEAPTITTPSTTVTREEAISKALAHAGLLPENATNVVAELDVDHGVTVYEVEFNSSGYEYEYEINAETGKILKAEKERID